MFLVKNFPVGQRVLVDSSSGQSATQGDGKKEEVTRQGEIPFVKEVALVSLGYNRSRPYLLVRSSTDTIHKSTYEGWIVWASIILALPMLFFPIWIFQWPLEVLQP